jgi:hypothetical protein
VNSFRVIGATDSELSNALTGLMDRTLSSSMVSEAEKQRRITICTRAINAANLFGPWWILPRVLNEWQAFLKSVDFGLFLTEWSRVDRPITTYYAQCVVAVIISNVQVPARDDRWVQLVTRQIKVSKSVLRRYFTHGDSILLANLNNIVRQTLQASSDIGEHHEEYIKKASCTLEPMCKFDTRTTSPELQDDFCKLWNEHVDVAQNGQHPYARNISLTTLKNIRKVYISLHEGMLVHPPLTAFAAIDDSDTALDDIASYPTCTINSHGSALSGRPPNVQGQAPTVGGNASQPPVSHPSAPHLPSPASVTSTTHMPFPTPVSTPIGNASQAFPGHQGAGPVVHSAIHVGHSAPQAPSNGSSTSIGFPSPLVFPTPGPRATRPKS